MAEKGNGGYRDKMRDECIHMHATLLTRKRIRVRDLADETGISLRTAYRWINSFSMVMPMRIEHGFVIVGEEVL
jgi:predicted DNA-binding transcriptional regulator YafY